MTGSRVALSVWLWSLNEVLDIIYFWFINRWGRWSTVILWKLVLLNFINFSGFFTKLTPVFESKAWKFWLGAILSRISEEIVGTLHGGLTLIYHHTRGAIFIVESTKIVRAFTWPALLKKRILQSWLNRTICYRVRLVAGEGQLLTLFLFINLFNNLFVTFFFLSLLVGIRKFLQQFLTLFLDDTWYFLFNFASFKYHRLEATEVFLLNQNLLLSKVQS